MAGKRAREPSEDEPAPRSTPKKLRFGAPAAASSPAQRTPSKSALKKTNATNGTASPATTPSGRASKKSAAFTTPTKQKGKDASTPTAARQADRSARKKATRNLIERAAAGDLSDEEIGDQLADRIYDSDEAEDEEQEQNEEDGTVLPSTEAPADGTEAGTAAAKRGRGRPKGAKNKRTPTPPPDMPPYERYFFQNRQSAWKYTSQTPNDLKLLAHGEYYDAIGKLTDPHASSIAALHALHARSFPRWAFEMREGFAVVLHGYGSKRRLLTGFAEYLHNSAIGDPPSTVIAHAHHPAFSLRALLGSIARAAGLDAASLPTAPAAMMESIEAHLSSRTWTGGLIYVLISTVTARVLTTPAALTILASLSANPRIALLLTASNPSFPLLWPSPVRDALNPVMHDATTFLPYDSGTGAASAEADPDPDPDAPSVSALPIAAPPPGLSALGPSAPDAVAELLGRKAGGFATRERVRWVLRSLPTNARGLYGLLLEDILATADAEADGDLHVNDRDDALSYDPFAADPDMNLDFFDAEPPPPPPLPTMGKRGRGRPRKDPGFAAGAGAGAATAMTAMTTKEGPPLPAISSKTLYQRASAAFLCSSEMAFRGLLREFVDHAMVEVRRNEVGGEGGEMLGVGMGRAEAEGVLEDLGREGG